MIIVSGEIRVDPTARDDYLEDCRDVIETARRATGCVDFHLTADPLEPGRINVYERWESTTAVEEFRGSGPSATQTAAIQDITVFQHEVASSERL